MPEDLLFVTGIKPSNIRESNRLSSETRAHAARVSHQRRISAKGPAKRTLRRQKTGGVARVSKKAYEAVAAGQEIRKLNLSPRTVAWHGQHSLVLPNSPSNASDSSKQDASDAGDFDIHRYEPFLPEFPLLPRQPLGESFVVFDQTYETRSYHIWTTILSRRTAHYGFHCREVFLRIIPQRALTSSAVRHMVLAHSLAHEYKRARPGEAHELYVKALHHYTKGLQAMYQSDPNTLSFLTAICVAFLIEALQDNYSGLQKHLKGYEEVVVRYQGEHDEDYGSLRGCFYAIRVYGGLMKLGTLHAQSSGPWNVKTSRAHIAEIIHRAGSKAGIRDPLELREIKTALGQWFGADRVQHRTHEATVNRQAIYLLFNFAITLLPEADVGALSCYVDSKQVELLVDEAEMYFDKGKLLRQHEKKELTKTIKLLAECIVGYVPDSSCQEKATKLLQQIKLDRSRRPEGW